MNRNIIAYEHYYEEFFNSLDLKTQDKFQKKTQKTPKNEIEKAIRLKNEYFKRKKEL